MEIGYLSLHTFLAVTAVEITLQGVGIVGEEDGAFTDGEEGGVTAVSDGIEGDGSEHQIKER